VNRVVTSNPKPESLATLHIISHLDWEREGVDTFEVQRARLLNTLSRLSSAMSPNENDHDNQPILKHFMLGGQTVILEDVNAVRPDLVALLSIYNAGGRLAIGPWYVQVDGMMVSGESLVRNLLLGRVDSKRHGAKVMPIAYMPDICEHTAQLPQILSSFEIESAFLCQERTMMPLPFRWEAPDGSSVLVMNYQRAGAVQDAIEQQKDGQPDGPFLWMNRVDYHNQTLFQDFDSQVDLPVTQSTLAVYALALREGLPDALRPTLAGELRLHETGRRSGRFSARINLKQSNTRLQTHLTYAAEPWLALALTHGAIDFPDNIRALLDYAWRLLLQNQAHSTLGGFSSDGVTQETEIRSHKLSDVSVRVIHAALEALPGSPGWRGQFAVVDETAEEIKTKLPQTGELVDTAAAAPPLNETYITVWNPHSWQVEQVVGLSLRLPDHLNPDVLTNAEGEEIAFAWHPAEKSSDFAGRITFRATIPPVGYATFSLSLTPEPVLQRHLMRTLRGKAIGSATGETITADNGQIHWSRDTQRIDNLLNFYDGGDAGDIAEYRQPQPDIMVRAGMTDAVKIESCASYERMIIRHRMRISPQLRPGGGRDRGLKLLDLNTTLTFYDRIPGVFLRTTFVNDARDHRLRAHIRTGLKTAKISADVAYGLVRRQPQAGLRSHPQPMHSAAVASSMGRTFALLTKGLMEFEPLTEDGQTSLALTLLRSVGWINRDAKLPAPGAQVQRPMLADYALIPLPPDDPALVLQTAQSYTAPLQAYQYVEKPQPTTRSYLSLDNRHLLMTSLKPPQSGKGWIVRLLNPTDKLQVGKLNPFGKLSTARLVNLAEEDQAEYDIAKDGFTVRVEPHKIHTLRLLFDS